MSAGARSICIAAVMLVFAVSARGQVWDTIPPPLGGQVLCLDRNGSQLLAVVGEELSKGREGHLYSSSDNGDSWRMLPGPSDTRGDMQRVAMGNRGVMFYMTGNKLFRMSSGGNSWTELGTPAVARGFMRDIAVDTLGRLYLHVSTYGLWVSADNGDQWMACTAPSARPIDNKSVMACVGQDVYFWWRSNGADTVFQSTNQGTSWRVFNTGGVPRAVCDGGDGRVLLSTQDLSGMNVPFRLLSMTRDGVVQDTLLARTVFSGYVIDPEKERPLARFPGGMIAHTIVDTNSTRAILLSSDSGTSWLMKKDPGFGSFDAIEFTSEGNLLTWGSSFGIIKLRTISGGLEHVGLHCMQINDSPTLMAAGAIFAPSQTMSETPIFKWDSVAGRWSMPSGCVAYKFSFGHWPIAMFAKSADTISMIIGQFLSRRVETGEAWTTLFRAKVLSCGNPSLQTGRWIAAAQDSIRLSGNMGLDWVAIPQPELILSGNTTIVEIADTTFFCSNQGALWQKAGAQAAWKVVSRPGYIDMLVPGPNGVLYGNIRTVKKLHRSTDKGLTWNELPTFSDIAANLLVTESGTLVALDTAKGLYISTDDGETWANIPLEGVYPRSIAYGNGRLFVGTLHLGLLHAALRELLSPVSLLQPRHDAECLATQVVLRWSRSPGVSGLVRVRCGTLPGLSESLILDTLVTGDELTVNTLGGFIGYFWKVDIPGNGGAGSPTWKFSTAGLPSPFFKSPTDNERCVSPTTGISWLGQQCISHYEIEIAEDSQMIAGLKAYSVSGDTTTLRPQLAFGRTYYSRIRGESPAGTGSWHGPLVFHTIADSLAAPLQLEPADGGRISAAPAGSIRWEKHACVTKSEIIVCRVPDFRSDTVANILRQDPANYLTISGQWGNGVYYWKVRAWRDTVPGHWSPVRNFTLNIPVGIQTELSPEQFGIVNIFPQPAGDGGDMLHVEYCVDAETDVILSVYDALGQERLIRKQPHSLRGVRSTVLDVSSLPAGAYILTLSAGERRTYRQLAIVR